jgi:outer membrane protein OmpA-like peptidoglycan-associated protein
MKKIIPLICIVFTSILIHAQPAPVQNGNNPKDALINVQVVEMKTGKQLANEIVIFKSRANSTEFQGLTDSIGKFSIRLPFGTKYDYFILGFKDSLSYNELEIPALKPNQFYKGVFSNIKIEFEAPASFVIDGCNFETGKAILKEEAYTVLDELVAYLKRKDDEKVELGGHTDNVGKADANLILSTNRAKAVMAYLIEKGIPTERLTAKGYGMTVPIADNKTPDGRALNRRTEVKIIE